VLGKIAAECERVHKAFAGAGWPSAYKSTGAGFRRGYKSIMLEVEEIQVEAYDHDTKVDFGMRIGLQSRGDRLIWVGGGTFTPFAHSSLLTPLKVSTVTFDHISTAAVDSRTRPSSGSSLLRSEGIESTSERRSRCASANLCWSPQDPVRLTPGWTYRWRNLFLKTELQLLRSVRRTLTGGAEEVERTVESRNNTGFPFSRSRDLTTSST
jgi:hypothetical protein